MKQCHSHILGKLVALRMYVAARVGRVKQCHSHIVGQLVAL